MLVHHHESGSRSNKYLVHPKTRGDSPESDESLLDKQVYSQATSGPNPPTCRETSCAHAGIHQGLAQEYLSRCDRTCSSKPMVVVSRCEDSKAATVSEQSIGLQRPTALSRGPGLRGSVHRNKHFSKTQEGNSTSLATQRGSGHLRILIQPASNRGLPWRSRKLRSWGRFIRCTGVRSPN